MGSGRDREELGREVERDQRKGNLDLWHYINAFIIIITRGSEGDR